MYDMRDIREILIHQINIRFTVMKVKSLLAYQIFLFLIFNTDRKRLITQNYILVKFSSLDDLALQLQEFYKTNIKHERTSIKSALGSLEKAAVIMSTSLRPSEEEVEVLELERKFYTYLYLDVSELRDGYEEKFFDNNYRHKIFDKYLIPQIKELNTLLIGNNVSLRAYQMALYFIFQLNIENFDDTFETDENEIMAFSEYLLESLDDFSDYFSTFVDLEDVPQSTISDNLHTLHNLGFIHLSRLNPEEDDEYKNNGYPDKEHLNIVIPLLIPSMS